MSDSKKGYTNLHNASPKAGFLYRPFSHVLLIIAIGLLAYSNTFHVPFTFDDVPNIIENPRIRNVANIPSMFTEFKGPPISARPLTSATFALNYYLGGLHTTGYHIFNLTLHAINGILLYYLILLTARLMRFEDDGKIRLVAFFSSLIFIAHPIQTESVTYIVSRSVLLSTMFFFLGILLFVKAVTSEKREILYTAALFLTSLLGMASREEFFIFPFMLILYDFFFVSKSKLRDVLSHYRSYIPVFLTLSYLLYIVLSYDYKEHAGFEVKTVTPIEYLLTQFNVHWTYIRLLILPINQNLDYDYPIAEALFEFPTIISFVGYIGLWIFGICVMIKRKPVISFCVLWFLIVLVPSSSVIPIRDVIFEHRLYTPLASASILMTICILFIKDGLRVNWRKFESIPIWGLTIVVLILTGACYARNQFWENEVILWEDVVMKSPSKARGHNNLGVYYYIQAVESDGNAHLIEKSINHLEIALEIDPHYKDAHNNLGDAYLKSGLADKAIEQYRIALRIKPNDPVIYYNLGCAYQVNGVIDKAIEQYQTAIRINSTYTDAHINLGTAFKSQGLIDKAISQYQIAIKLDPTRYEGFYNLGNAFREKGLIDKSIQMYLSSLKLNPTNPNAHFNLGIAYQSKGLISEAIEQYKVAIKLRPDLIKKVPMDKNIFY